MSLASNDRSKMSSELSGQISKSVSSDRSQRDPHTATECGYEDSEASRLSVGQSCSQPMASSRSLTTVLQWSKSPSSSAEVMALTKDQPATLPRSKARQNLQLPPFKLLGIAMPHPDFLLTPPDEVDEFPWGQPVSDLQPVSSSLFYQNPANTASEGNTPQTPVVKEFLSESGTETPKPSHPAQSQSSEIMTSTTSRASEETSTTSGSQDLNSRERLAGLQEAVEIAGRFKWSTVNCFRLIGFSVFDFKYWRTSTCHQRSLPHPTLPIIRECSCCSKCVCLLDLGSAN